MAGIKREAHGGQHRAHQSPDAARERHAAEHDRRHAVQGGVGPDGGAGLAAAREGGGRRCRPCPPSARRPCRRGHAVLPTLTPDRNAALRSLPTANMAMPVRLRFRGSQMRSSAPTIQRIDGHGSEKPPTTRRWRSAEKPPPGDDRTNRAIPDRMKLAANVTTMSGMPDTGDDDADQRRQGHGDGDDDERQRHARAEALPLHPAGGQAVGEHHHGADGEVDAARDHDDGLRHGEEGQAHRPGGDGADLERPELGHLRGPPEQQRPAAAGPRPPSSPAAGRSGTAGWSARAAW